MLKTLNAVNTLLGTLLGLLVATILGAVGLVGYQTYYADQSALDDAAEKLAAQEATIAGLSEDLQGKQDQIERLDVELENRHAEIVELKRDVEKKQREIEKLDMALRLLKVDHRVAQLDVLGQQGSAESGDLVTTVRFVELNEEGDSLDEPRVFEIEGDVVYVESWVVKFNDDYVEMGDPLRSTSLYLFRRIFGEEQQPAEGFSLDPEGSSPAAYRSNGEMSDLEQEIWARFWHYANDPKAAESLGVRAAHGEAPFQKLVPGKRYKLLLRASDGLTFVPEDLPPEAPPGMTTETL